MKKNIVIYTVDYCPYCHKALDFFKKNNIDFEQIDITSNESEMRKELGEKYEIKGDVTVPQIIVNGKRIGGYTDLMANPDAVRD